jgi:hypothetical protein
VSISTLSDLAAASAHTGGPAQQAVVKIAAALTAGLGGRTASVVIYFASAGYDPAEIAGPLSRQFPGAAVIGCSTAGEFTEATTGTGGISAVALPEGMIARTAAALGDLTADVAAGADAAVDAVERSLGEPLRGLDPARHLAFTLIDGMHGSEELVNERLGNAAPILDVVGGSAGDDLAFERTWVALGDQVSSHGVALLVVESGVPFRIVKTSSFTPSGTQLTITKADVPNRTVLEFDGRPAVDAYAHALGIPIEAVDASAFMAHPVGLMIDGEPWIRSPRATVDGGGIAFFAQILEGMEVDVMNSGDLVAETAAAIRAATADLGGRTGGAVMFNCILRRLQLDAEHTGDAFVRAFDGLPLAGFHTYGETWLGHVNQTLTGVVFG